MISGKNRNEISCVAPGGEPQRRPRSLPRARLPLGWSALDGEAAFLAATLPLDALPAESDAMAEALAAWTLARLEDLRTVLPGLAAH